MAAPFQPLAVKVPGFLSDEGLAAYTARQAEAAKTVGKAQIPSSAVEFADKVVQLGKQSPGPALPAAKAAKPAGLPPAEATPPAGSLAAPQGLVGGILSTVGQLPSAIAGIGAITDPVIQAQEQQGIVEEARLKQQAVEDAAWLRNRMNEDFEPPDPEMLQPALDRYAARLREQREAEAEVAAAKKTLPSQYPWANALHVATRSAAQMGVSALRFPADVFDLMTSTAEEAAAQAGAGDIPASGMNATVQQWFEGVDKNLDALLPGDKARSKQFLTQLSAGAGSMAGFLLTGYAAKTIGIPSAWATASLGAANEADTLYQEADTFGATGLQKYLALLFGAGLGTTEAIPIDRAFMRADAATGGLVRNLLQNTAATSLEEFLQEYSQTAGEDLIAKYGAGYDPDRKLDPGSWLSAGAVGAITGGAVGATTSVIEEMTPQPVEKVDDAKLTGVVDEALAASQQQFDSIFSEDEAAAVEPGAEGEVPEAAGEVEVRAKATVPGLDPVRGDAVTQINDIEQIVAEQFDATAITEVIDAADLVLEGPGAEAITEFIGHPAVPVTEHGIMDARKLEDIARGNNPEAAAQIETAFSPIREQLRAQVGDTIRLYRVQRPVKREDNVLVHGMPEDGRRAALSWSSNPKFAREYAGVGKERKVYSDDEIAVFEKTFTEKGQVKIGRHWLVKEDSQYPVIYPDRNGEPALDDMVTDTDSVRDYINTENEWAREDNARNAKRAQVIVSAEVPLEDVMWISGRANQSEFIVRNDPSRPVYINERGQARDRTPIDRVVLSPSDTSPLPNLEKGLQGPIPIVVKAAKAYAAAAQIPHRRQREYVKVDVARAARVAQAYADMQHQPQDPAVLAAYTAMAEETLAQYQYVKATGLKIEAIQQGQEDPYPNGPRDVLKDINAGHIWYYPTKFGFGSDAKFDPKDNPLLEPTNEVSDNGEPMLVNDVFRVVHDFFGHGLEGSGFGARGEENAWQSHMRLYSASAVPAMTSETRGQNSWVNYGPHGEWNRTHTRETIYADQKSGLMPSWTWEQGIADSLADDLDAPVAATDAKAFHDAFAAAKAASPYGAVAHLYSPAKYAKMKLFLTPDGLSGFALDGENIVSVFSHNNAPRGRLRKIIDTALANGGRKLDAFDTGLPRMYAALGFREVDRKPFEKKYAPKDWDYDKLGEPDVVFMEYGSDIEQDVGSTYGTHSEAFKAWDDGAAIRAEPGDTGDPGGDGPPLVLYSGAPHDLRIATRDMWLTPDRRTAEQFAHNSREEAKFDEEGNNIGGDVFTFFARMDNPYEIDWEGNNWSQGPNTEYPTIYYITVNGESRVAGPFNSYSEADSALDEARDNARDTALEDTRYDIEGRVYTREVDGKFEVLLKSDAPTADALANSVKLWQSQVEGHQRDLAKEVARVDAEKAAKPGMYVYDSTGFYLKQIMDAETRRDEYQRQLDATTANPPQDELLGAFDTEDDARDFEESYAAEKADNAAVDAYRDFEGEIEEETDYEIEEGQTTDNEVAYAKANGYDGVIFRNVDEGSGPVDVYVILKPGNAKSTASLGGWNPDDPDILRMTGTATTRKPYALEPTRPTKGIPLAPNTTTDPQQNDIRLTQISKNFVKALDITARAGRLAAKNKNVMGEYHRQSAVTRLRTWTDFATLVHEGGHALNDMHAQPMDEFIDRNRGAMSKIANTLYGGDLTKAPIETILREGFAEFFRVYSMTPAYARNRWGALTTDFENTLDGADPKLRTALNKIADQFQAWLQLPSSQLVENMVVDGRRAQGIEAAVKELKDAGFKSWMQEHARRAVEWSVNRYAPLNQMVTDLLNLGEENRGVSLDLKRADDPRVIARLARNSGARAQVQLTDGVIGYRSTQSGSRGLREAILTALNLPPDSVPGSLDQTVLKSFDAYLVSRRALDEWRRYEAGEIERPPTGAQKGDHVRHARETEKQYPHFIQAAEIVHEFGMALWQKRYEAGLMDKETYQEGLQRQFYAPLQRDVTDKQGTGADSLQFGSSVLTKGPRFKGSDRDIISPMTTLMHMTFALERQIAENDAKKALAILADRAGKAGALVERIPASQLVGQTFSVQQVAQRLVGDTDLDQTDAADLLTILGGSIEQGDMMTLFRSEQAGTQGENVLFFWENGKVAALRLTEKSLGSDVVNLMNGLGRENMDITMELIAGTSGVFRTAITKWPDFLIVNYIRDQMSAWVLTDVGFTPFVSGIRGMVDELRQKDWAKSYNVAGGIMGGMNTAALHKARVDRDLNALRAKGYKAQLLGDMDGTLGGTLMGAARAFGRVTELSETGTRLGLFRAAYNRGKADGLTDYEASIEASYIATDYIDFGLNGSKMLTSRRIIPFLNAQIQGLYKMVRTLGGDEVAQRKGLKFVLGAYFKSVKNLPLSRVEKQQINTGRLAWVKMAALGLFSAVLYLLFKDDPDVQEAGENLRVTGWVLPAWAFGGEAGNIIWIPKPFELALVANAVERGLEFASGDREAPGRFMRGVAMALTPPTSPPALQTLSELQLNKDFFTGRDIVPDYMQALDPLLQYDNYTSSFAKQWAGVMQHTPFPNSWKSPMMIDHMFSGLGASAYRDIMTIFNMADPTRPAPDNTDLPIIRRFVRDVRRGSVTAQDFWAQASTTSGALERARATYKRYTDAGNEIAANRFLSKLSGDERAYALLTTKFETDAKRLNPFYRARQVTTIIGAMRREISSAESLADTTVKDVLASIPMTAGLKGEVEEILSEIARREVRNTMIATQQPGWANKKRLPLGPTLDMLLAVSPETYDEYVRRYQKAKVYDAEPVYENWPETRDRLNSDGEYAVLTDLVTVASAGGIGIPQ
jgi:hypothetical protein